MWFTKTKEKTKRSSKQTQIHEQLAQLNTDGVQVSIEELLQYQQKYSLIDLAAHKNLHGQLSGNYLARSKGRGMEFDEVRHYQIGDDIRAIDWRVTARTGKTHTKLFREEVERPVLIATDLTHNMQFGSQLLLKSVQAAHLSALIAWHAKQRGDRVGGIVFNDITHSEFKPRSRKTGVLHYLHGLVELQTQALANLAADNKLTTHETDTGTDRNNNTETNTPFAKNCARLRQLARPGSLVYLLTDGLALNDTSIRHLTHISQHCELVVVKIVDPLEVELPTVNQKTNVLITDGNNSQQLTLGDQKTAQEYQLCAQTLIQQQKHLFHKTGARLINISAAQSIEEQIKQGASTWIR